MSRVFDALRRSEIEAGRGASDAQGQGGQAAVDLLESFAKRRTEGALPGDDADSKNRTAPDYENAAVVRFTSRPECRLVSLESLRSSGAEQFRLLSTKLFNLQRQSDLKKLLITSCMVGDGKSTTAANLAATIGRHGKRKVLLLEGDLHRPVLASLLGLDGAKGLSDCLEKEEPVSKFMYRSEGSGMWLLAGGTPSDNPLQLLQSDRLFDVMKQFEAFFDWVVIDAPPLLSLADTHWWARIADGVLLVVREGFTNKRLLGKALESLDSTKLLGIVLNESLRPEHNYYQQYYGGKVRLHPSDENQP